MANEYGFPFDAIRIGDVYDREYTSDDFASYFGKLIGNGIYAQVGNCLEVISETNDMNLTIRRGACFINGRAREWIEDQTLRLSNSHGSYDRIDYIVARLSMIERKITLEVVEGVASANPIAPNLTQTEDIYELLLAEVSVKTGVTAISQTNITDKRSTSLCGFVSGLINQIDAESFFEQYEVAFREWLDGMRDVLDENTATNLYNMINDVSVVNKVTLTASGWSNNIQEIYLTGITADSYPIIDVQVSGSFEEKKQIDEEWGKVISCETWDGYLRFVCKEVPTIDFVVIVKGLK